MNKLIEQFKATYSNIIDNQLQVPDTIYAQNITFIDPFHHINGLDNMRTYLQRAFKHIIKSEFNFTDEIISNDKATLFWKVHLQHQKLRGGKPICTYGCTLLKFSDLIYYRRDYFDTGELIYENLPLLGPIVRKIRKNL